jgi:site-specific recombinase XerD
MSHPVPDLRTPAVARRFLDHCRVAKRLSPNTLRAYDADLNDFVGHLGRSRRVGQVGRDDLRGYARVLLDKRGLKETTVRRRMATLKILFRWLEREEVVALSPFYKLDMVIRLPRRLPRALHTEEIRRLLMRSEAATRRRRRSHAYDGFLLHFAIVVLFTTGLRISELVAADVSDVRRREGSIHVRGKGNRERRVYVVGKVALGILDRFLTLRSRVGVETDRLLVSSQGRPLTAAMMRRRLRHLAERAGIPRRVTPHMLRHTAATQLVEAGVDIRVVQQLLGHASIATTQIYTHVSDASLRERLAAADTLGRVRRLNN